VERSGQERNAGRRASGRVPPEFVITLLMDDDVAVLFRVRASKGAYKNAARSVPSAADLLSSHISLSLSPEIESVPPLDGRNSPRPGLPSRAAITW
jgi:hypothetical protein